MFNEIKYNELKAEVKQQKPNATPYEVCDGALILAERRGIELEDRPKLTPHERHLQRMNEMYQKYHEKVGKEHPELSLSEVVNRAMDLHYADPRYRSTPELVSVDGVIMLADEVPELKLAEKQSNCRCKTLKLSELKAQLAAEFSKCNPGTRSSEIHFCPQCRRKLD